MIAVKDSEYDSQLLTGIRVALSKARELGYPVECMDVTASVSHGICSVHFAPFAEPGAIVTGGELLISVDPDSKQISNIERGQ